MKFTARNQNWGYLIALACLLLCGCATSNLPGEAGSRRFSFLQDTFSYPNELVWEYRYDENGKWTTHRRETKPDYAQHCFVVARSAKQFFAGARFDPQQPVADEETYRKLVRRVVSLNPRKPVAEEDKIIIPGYPDLRAFSEAHEALLKAECGGAWQCYLQRGNWRMVIPFSRNHQEHAAREILSQIESNRPAVVHLVRFPQLTINHAVLVYDSQETDSTIGFLCYDPNQPSMPLSLSFDRRNRTFSLPPNEYFPGGRVDLYQIYNRWNY
ncbi:MAG TPA: hypothetical protein VEC99_01345 [Clostridia bacterium]|nr:hypothetical protein [Clostridia bacterium]